MVDLLHTSGIHTTGQELADKDYQRFGVYYDAQMLEDETLVMEELERRGDFKVNRSSTLRYLLRQEAQRIRKRRKAQETRGK